MTGKDGQIRNNLMGKRVEFSGRTVIGPDPNLKFGEMGLPKQVAEELTVPEMVTSFNKEYLMEIVNNGKANFVMKNGGDTRINLKYAMFRKGTELLYGDVVIRGDNEIPVVNGNVILQKGDKVRRAGKVLTSLSDGDIIIRKGVRLAVSNEVYTRYGDQVERLGKKIPLSSILTYPTQKRIYLNIGDVVHRHLKNNDIILLNRQPTLHKGSMLAKRARIMPGKTFRMNLATTKTFNADFDGDEMNIHVPQSLESRVELECLSATQYNIISAQASKPNIVIVQDSLLAVFLMTKENLPITKSQFFDISMHGERDGKPLWSPTRVMTIKKVLKMKGKKPVVYNGRGLISLLLPDDFIYEKKNDSHPCEPYVRIYRGVMYEGALDKSILGSSHNSLIQVINKEYGSSVAAEFISNIQFITNNWLLVNSFSVGLEDCLITSPDSVLKIQDKISRCYVEAEGIEATTHNPGIREVRIAAALSKAKDVGMKIAKDSMSVDNNLLSTVHSGSKGDFFNIAQLTGLLGQQNLLGKRVTPTLNHGKRTLPHYPFGKLDKEVEYESRGFIRHSFIEGLNPQEYFFHAMSGREGICDTAMGTAKTGYIQRRIIKVCEDIQIKYDGSVRDTTGNIYQMAYGDNGFDPCETVKVGGSQAPCDISRIINRLNLQFEMKGDNILEKDSTQVETVKTKKIVKQVETVKKTSRISLLKSLAKKTGVRKMYKGWSISDLTQRLESLELEE
jgi:DNA-directed RNA polymerase beta' subunit